MDFSIESKISNFIENQFPSFYKDEGKGFILFMKTYYEWLEATNNPLYNSRNLLNFRDIDNTLEEFLEFFQKKYIYGIPVNVIINKRFLIKHILDVYRSKSSIQGYKLLFRILYNEDIEIYLPGIDVLRVSDGTWKTPEYLEVTAVENIDEYVGKEIQGVYSNTVALVDSVIKENFYRTTINTMFINNVRPKGADFSPGEKIVIRENLSNSDLIQSSPTLLGSLSNLTILNGGQEFKRGHVLKIAKYDLDFPELVMTQGENGFLKVVSTSRGLGAINFDVLKQGFGYLSNSEIMIYNGNGDVYGSGASFELGPFSNTKFITYNTDVICDYLDLTINASSYGFPANSSANEFSNTGDAFTYQTGLFGSILVLTNIKTGNGYIKPVDVFVRSTLLSNNLPGDVFFDTTSNTVTGNNTIFDEIFIDGDVIHLTANSSLSNTEETFIIKEVVSNTELTLYKAPSNNSTPSALYKAAPVILPSNFAFYEEYMKTSDGSISGQNEIITGYSSTGNDVVFETSLLDSGKGYEEGETVIAYLYGGLNTPVVENGGIGYANGDPVIFSGGGTTSTASGFVSTNTSGGVISVSLTDAGSGYTSEPFIKVKSLNGYGAVITATISEYNTVSSIIGRVEKSGIGRSRGFWTTTRGFLNSDKYIQDSYYYQDYSYEIKIAKSFEKYKDIIYSTFHIAGSELFGKYMKTDTLESLNGVLYTNTEITIT